MNYNRYHRALVMLEAQSSEFCAKEGAVKGHLKVETGHGKGALRCTVQNLRYYPKGEYIYKLILFGRKGERTLHSIIGNLVVNRYGNSETYFRFNPVDVDDKGNCLDDYFAAIVAAVSTRDAQEPLHPVLKGTLETEAACAPPETFSRARVKAAAHGEEAAAEGTDETGEDGAAQEEPEAAEAAESGEPAEEPSQAAMADEESGAPESDQSLEPLENDSTEAQEVEETARRPANYNHFYNEYLLNICGYTCKVADYYEDVYPFDSDKTEARWKKILDVGNLPLVSPGARHFATQYQHYLFGAQPGPDGVAVKYYFAIPGRLMETEQPDGGRSGFNFWQPVRGAEREKSAYGYWIVCVDARTGDIQDVI